MKRKPEIHYYYRGQVARGADYHWVDAYSPGENGVVQYPWMTYRECQHDAKVQDCRAIIHKRNYK